jgi:hypothetical protein
VSALSGENVSQWYSLIKEVLSDIRGRAFKTNREKHARYTKLHTAFRAIHEDYIKILTSLIDDLISCPGHSDLEKSKRRFLKARKQHSADRTLTKFDAQMYLSIATDLGEKRYLTSLITYFYYETDPILYATTFEQVDLLIWDAAKHGGDHGWNSASSAFWFAAQYSESKDELIGMAKSILAALGKRFAMAEIAFSELDGNWRGTAAISRSRMTEILEADGIIKSL